MVEITRPTYTGNGANLTVVRLAARNIILALNTAIAEFERLAPNQKDFAYQGAHTAFRDAQAEHRERIRVLNRVKKQAELFAEHARDFEVRK